MGGNAEINHGAPWADPASSRRVWRLRPVPVPAIAPELLIARCPSSWGKVTLLTFGGN